MTLDVLWHKEAQKGLNSDICPFVIFFSFKLGEKREMMQTTQL